MLLVDDDDDDDDESIHPYSTFELLLMTSSTADWDGHPNTWTLANHT